MSFEKQLDVLARRGLRALEMGGAQKIEKQHARGKLTPRERIKRLCAH